MVKGVENPTTCDRVQLSKLPRVPTPTDTGFNRWIWCVCRVVHFVGFGVLTLWPTLATFGGFFVNE